MSCPCPSGEEKCCSSVKTVDMVTETICVIMLGFLSMLWDPDLPLRLPDKERAADKERAEQLKAKEKKKALNPFSAVAKRKKKLIDETLYEKEDDTGAFQTFLNTSPSCGKRCCSSGQDRTRG